MMIQPQSVQTPAMKPASPAQPAPKVSQEDIDWALQLEKEVKEGTRQPSSEDMARYTQIFEGLQAQTKAIHGAQSVDKQLTPESVSSVKGLLDYPKDLAMSVTEFAAEGQAKNMVELFADGADIKRNLGDSWEHLKKGEIASAALDTVRALGNTGSASVNFLQVGFSAMLGGVSTVVSLPLNLLDKGAEKAGQYFAGSENTAGKAVGKVFTVLGGENSNVGYQQALQSAARRGAQEARSD